MDPATGNGARVDVDDRRSGVGVVACVTDDVPRLHVETVRWYAALNRVAGVDSADLAVHAVGPVDSVELNYLRNQGVAVRSIELFDSRYRYCNKITGAQRLAEEGVAGMVVLTDSDVAFVEDPRRLGVDAGAVGSRLVKQTTPTVEQFTELFAAAGLPLPPRQPLDWPPGAVTLEGYGNGGLYVFEASLLDRLARAWAHWATWLLDRLTSPDPKTSIYTDQASMFMAMVSENLVWQRLNERWNLAPNNVWRHDPSLEPPAGLHYHRSVQENGDIPPTGLPLIDARIDLVNQAYRVVRSEMEG